MRVVVKTKNLTRKEWLEYRTHGIGGSDVSIIAGINPFRSVHELWLEKTGQIKIEETESEYAYLGTLLEPIVRKEFMTRTGLKVRQKHMLLQSDEYPFMYADLDGVINENGEFVIFEAKTASQYKKELWEEGVPAEYILQVQHYMAVTGAKKTYIAALIGGNHFMYHVVERDEKMIAKISDIADVQGGMVLSRKEAKSPEDTVCEYQRLTLRSFDETGNIDKVELETFHACESLENVLFTQTGDVVIRLVSPMYPVYIEAGYDGILVPSQFAVLRVKDNMEIAPEYLRLCLAQRIIQDRILNLESGTAQKTVKIKTVLDLEIPLQPLHIQQEAVQIDRLGRKRELMYRELIENERILTEHLIEKMIGGTNR